MQRAVLSGARPIVSDAAGRMDIERSPAGAYADAAAQVAMGQPAGTLIPIPFHRSNCISFLALS